MLSLGLGLGICSQTLVNGGAPAPTISYTARGNNSSSTDSATYNFAGSALGPVASDKWIVGSVELRATGVKTLTSVVVDGITATLLGTATVNSNSGNTSLVQFFAANLGADANTSGTIQVNVGGGTALRCAIQWGSTAGAAPVLSDSAEETPIGSNPSGVIDVPGNSFALGAHITTTNTATGTAWTLTSENGDAIVENTLLSQGYQNFVSASSGLTVGATITSLPNIVAFQCVAISP